MLAQTVQDHESCLRFSVRLSAIFREILCTFVSFCTWPNPFGTQILKKHCPNTLFCYLDRTESFLSRIMTDSSADCVDFWQCVQLRTNSHGYDK